MADDTLNVTQPLHTGERHLLLVDNGDNTYSLATSVQDSALPDGAATAAKQTPPVTTPTLYNVTLTSADTEYSQALPANTRDFRFRCRTLYDVRYAFATGKVATPTAPYMTLPAGSDYISDLNNLTSITLYLASAQAGVVVELEAWA